MSKPVMGAPDDTPQVWGMVDRIEALETALEDLLSACLHLAAPEDGYGWVVFSDEHGDNVREFLVPAMQRASLMFPKQNTDRTQRRAVSLET